MSRHAARRDKLRRLLKKSQADALLVTSEPNVTYLTGFTGDSTYLLLTAKSELLLSDKRYTTQLEEECPDIAAEIRGPELKMVDLVGRSLASGKHKAVAIEADNVTVSWLENVSKKLKDVQFKSTSGMVEQLRMIKDAGEIEAIRTAIGCAHRAFDVVRASLRPDQTEKQVADAMESQVRLFGGDCTSFTPIIAVGHRAALPHYRPAKVKISESEFVLVDWGARVGGYVSDLTRILVTGKISPKLHKVYGVVSKAQSLAIAAIKHGAKLKDVDAAARGHIESCGFGKQFGHGLGHGIGLLVHEAPRMGPLEEAELQAGMVVTVEPGVYIPGWGGVRLEDDVLVTRTGAEVLSRGVPELEACVVAQ